MGRGDVARSEPNIQKPTDEGSHAFAGAALDSKWG